MGDINMTGIWTEDGLINPQYIVTVSRPKRRDRGWYVEVNYLCIDRECIGAGRERTFTDTVTATAFVADESAKEKDVLRTLEQVFGGAIGEV